MMDLFKGKMKTMVKLSLALIVVGGVIGFISFASMGFNIARVYMTGEQYETLYEDTEETFSSSKYNFDTINLDINSSDIEIVRAEGEDVKVKLPISKFNSEIVDNSLRISENEVEFEQYKWYRIFNVNSAPSVKIKIEVPKTFTGDIKIKNSYGDLRIKDIEGINNLDIDSNSGKITIANTHIRGNAKVNSKYGDTEIIEATIEGDISVKNNSGAFKAEELKGGNLRVDSKYGNSRFNNLSIKSLSVINNSGNTRVDNTEIDQEFFYDSKYGELRMDIISAPIFKLKAESGNIKGLIKGNEKDYKISAITQSGNNNLEVSHDGSKELQINSKYGNIDIEFQEN